MKVFKSEYDGSYGGGIVMIAANSRNEALEIVQKEELWWFQVWDDNTHDFVYKDDTEYMTKFEEVKDLVYTGENPIVICNNVYRE